LPAGLLGSVERIADHSSPPGGTSVAVSSKLDQLVHLTTTHFTLLNRNKFLSRFDRKRLKVFFLESLLDPRSPEVSGQNGKAPHDRNRALMTAKEVEAWLKIDVKTVYHYVKLKTIPHVRIHSNVRFRAADLQRWLERHSHPPREMRPKRR